MMVKICGITRAEDAAVAVSLGATALGFIFWPGSPRRIAPAAAAAISAGVPDTVWKVGVFVDSEIADVRRAVENAHLTAVQLHGSEPPTFAAALNTRVIKALALDRVEGPEALDDWPGVPILLDAHDPVQKGGTGRTIDWNRARQFAARHDVILAGGLCPENVAEAVARVQPYGIDVSTGVEAAPGVKDHGRLRKLFEALRGS